MGRLEPQTALRQSLFSKAEMRTALKAVDTLVNRGFVAELQDQAPLSQDTHRYRLAVDAGYSLESGWVDFSVTMPERSA